MDLHDEKFCNEKYDFQSDLICINKTKWLSEQPAAKSDPHSCQLSCLTPGQDCLACENSSYFLCPKSGQCVHPQLVCDGHPQCKEGEDEDLKLCHDKFIELKIIEPYASKRCTSPFYNNMDIYATPCNKIEDCADGSDESECQNNTKSNIILILSAVVVLLLFLASTLYHYLSEEQSPTKGQCKPKLTTDVLIKYKENHDDQTTVEEVNLHLLHIIKTQTIEDQNKTLISFYDLEEKKHNQNESEIFLCIHKKLDTIIITKMIAAKFPGPLEPIKNLLRNLSNMIIKSEMANKVLSSILALIKIELKYIDMCKDLGLSVIMLELIGGFQAIQDLPTNFGSVIVVVMFSSIFLPMIISSLHLINANVVDEYSLKSSNKIQKCILTGLFSLLSPFHPIILDTLHHQKLEKARRLAKQYRIEAVKAMDKCKTIKKQLVTFFKIELGKNRYLDLISFFELMLCCDTKICNSILSFRNGGLYSSQCPTSSSFIVQNKDSNNGWTYNPV